MASVLLGLVGVGGCGSDPGPEAVQIGPAEAPPSGLTIEANTQATDDDLRIGVGNIWPERYRGADGAEREGLTAGLWLSFRDTPDLDRHVRVHPGQRITVGGTTIEALDVTAGSATVRITRGEAVR